MEMEMERFMSKTNNQVCEYNSVNKQPDHLDRPQQLSALSDNDIEVRLKRLVKMEREALHEVLIHIREVYSRRIYLKRARSSLFDYLTRDMGYSAAAAQRRIDAARLSAELPEVLNSVKEGSLNLSQISLLAKACREKEKQNKSLAQQNHNPSLLDFSSKSTAAKMESKVDTSFKTSSAKVSTVEKQNILKELNNKSQRETEKIVLQAFSLPKLKKTKIQHQSDGSVYLEMPLSPGQWKAFKRCQELLAHKNPHGEWSEVLKLVCDFYISKKDLSQSRAEKSQKHLNKNQHDSSENRLVKKNVQQSSSKDDKVLASHQKYSHKNKSCNRSYGYKAASKPSASAAEVSSSPSVPTSAAEVDSLPFVPASISQNDHLSFRPRVKKRQALSICVRRIIFQRDRCCQFKDSSTGKICGSRYQLEIDHKIPVAHGGSNDLSNLRLTCRAHNQWLAVEKMGIRNIRGIKSI